MLKTRTVPTIPRVAKDESHAGAGEARIWTGLVSKIQSIDKLRYTGIGCEHSQTMIRVLKTVFAPRLQKLASQVGPDRVQQVKSWIWKAQHVKEWIDRADEVLIEAQAEERIAEQRRMAQTTITYSQWLETALKKGSKTAHRWTTQMATRVHRMDHQNSTTLQQSMLARTKEWGNRWNRDLEARDILLRQMHELRLQALSTAPRSWTTDALFTLSSMKGNRAGGVHGWNPVKCCACRGERLTAWRWSYKQWRKHSLSRRRYVLTWLPYLASRMGMGRGQLHSQGACTPFTWLVAKTKCEAGTVSTMDDGTMQ